MDSLPTIDIWACNGDRGAALKAIAGHFPARPPDFQGTIVHECAGVVVVRVQDFTVPPAAPETLYLIDGRGPYLESKRVEWLSFGRGHPRALLSMIPA